LLIQVQGKDPSVDITQDFVEESEDERFEDMSDTAPPVELPPCELNKLETINEVFIAFYVFNEAGCANCLNLVVDCKLSFVSCKKRKIVYCS
jgi:hypothetical protein